MSGPATAAEGPLQHLSPARDASGLSWAAKYVLLLLITYMGPRGIFPSQQTIATAAGLSKRKVWSALTELQGHGVVHADRGGRTKTSSYEIDLATLRSMSAPDVAGETHHVRVAPPASRTECVSETHHVRVASRTTCESLLKEPSMKEPSEGTNTEPLQLVPTEAAKALPEAEVWSFYRTVLKKWRKHTRTVDLGDKDRREIKARFKSGYTVDDLQLATLGLFADVWHRENEHLGLTYALRESNIEGFITVGRRERSIAPASPAVAASPLRDDDPSQLPARAVAPGSREEANVRSVDPPSLRAPVDYSTFNRAAGTLQ